MTKVAIYSVTHNKLDLTQRSFKELRLKAGIRFDHYVADSGSSDGTPDWLDSQMQLGQIKRVYLPGCNQGQNICANVLLDYITNDPDYDWVLRWDPDALPRSRRFLRKLVRYAELFKKEGSLSILSPKILKLKFPPEAIASSEDIGEFYEVVKILGGICRLHPIEVFRSWRFNYFAPLSFGEANEMADRATDLMLGMVRIPGIRVEHAHGEDGQKSIYPDEFGWNRTVARHMGYGL